jgi:hypothetical protein
MSPPEPAEVSALDVEARARLDAWRITFDSGHDFFGDLEPYGIAEPCHAWPMEKRPAVERKFQKAAKAAWHELGHAFLAQWKPRSETDVPWALERFGDPHGPLRRPRTLRR